MSPHRLDHRILMLVPLISILLVIQPHDIESLQQSFEDLPAPLVEEKLDYSTLRELDVSCPPLDTCSTPRKEDSLQTMNCECGERCAKYGTCCIDSPFVKDKVPNEYNEKCTPVPGTDFSVFMVKRCKRGWTGDSHVRTTCHANSHTPVDPLISVPVTDLITNVTYRNRYCALCNEVQNEVYPWLIALNVYAGKDALSASPDFKKSVIENMVYMNDSKTWGVWESITPEQRKFIPLNVGYAIPENLQSSVIHCQSNLVSTCVRTWHDVTTRKRCESYMAAIYLTVDNNQGMKHLGFRNIHCALCNHIPKERKYSCTSRRGNEGRPPMSFAVLLDVNQSDGSLVGQSSQCPSNEVYDPFFKKCKRMMCARSGYVIRGTKCVPP